MMASNVAGFTKKSVATSMVIIFYCAGNIAGPFLFFPSEAPRYPVSLLPSTIVSIYVQYTYLSPNRVDSLPQGLASVSVYS